MYTLWAAFSSLDVTFFAHVHLTRAYDARAVADHLAPVGDPAGESRQREHHGEHLLRDPKRTVEDAGVEVDVRVQVARHEVIVAEGGLLDLERHLVKGAVIGGFILGLGEILIVAFFPQFSGYRDAFAFLMLIWILFYKPTGLLGEKTTEKV